MMGLAGRPSCLLHYCNCGFALISALIQMPKSSPETGQSGIVESSSIIKAIIYICYFLCIYIEG